MIEPLQKSDFRWLLVLEMYLASAASGAVQVSTESQGLYYLLGLFMASAATLWTVSDAHRRGKPILHILQLLVFLLWPLAVPVYLVGSRGIRGLGWSILHAIGLMVALSIGSYFAVLLS